MNIEIKEGMTFKSRDGKTDWTVIEFNPDDRYPILLKSSRQNTVRAVNMDGKDPLGRKLLRIGKEKERKPAKVPLRILLNEHQAIIKHLTDRITYLEVDRDRMQSHINELFMSTSTSQAEKSLNLDGHM